MSPQTFMAFAIFLMLSPRFFMAIFAFSFWFFSMSFRRTTIRYKLFILIFVVVSSLAARSVFLGRCRAPRTPYAGFFTLLSSITRSVWSFSFCGTFPLRTFWMTIQLDLGRLWPSPIAIFATFISDRFFPLRFISNKYIRNDLYITYFYSFI